MTWYVSVACLAVRTLNTIGGHNRLETKCTLSGFTC